MGVAADGLRLRLPRFPGLDAPADRRRRVRLGSTGSRRLDAGSGHRMKAYRAWFYAAAAYNLVWGLAVCLFPGELMRLAGLDAPRYPALIQVIGMLVGVYAYGYWLLARDPLRYANLVWLGLLGKTLGPLGFLWATLRGELPLAFGWTILLNDLIWWP